MVACAGPGSAFCPALGSVHLGFRLGDLSRLHCQRKTALRGQELTASPECCSGFAVPGEALGSSRSAHAPSSRPQSERLVLWTSPESYMFCIAMCPRLCSRPGVLALFSCAPPPPQRLTFSATVVLLLTQAHLINFNSSNEDSYI